MSVMHQTTSWVLSLCHLTQLQRHLVDEILQMPILPDELAGVGRCLGQSYAMSDLKALDSDPRLAFCQINIVYFFWDHITFHGQSSYSFQEKSILKNYDVRSLELHSIKNSHDNFVKRAKKKILSNPSQ